MVPTESASNDNGPIAVMENLEVSNDIMKDDGTQIIKNSSETTTQEEVVPLLPLKQK